MVESIFTSQTPEWPNENDGYGYTMGTVFKSAVDGHVVGGRFLRATTAPTGAVKFGLWSITSNTTGTLLASATYGTLTSGWNEVLLETPYPITADTLYVTSYFTPNRYAIGNGTGSVPITNGNLTAVANNSPYGNARYAENVSDLTFPTSSNAGGQGAFADVLFEADEGDDPATGSIAGTLPALTGDLAGEGSADVAIAGTLPQLTADLAGSSTADGAIAGNLPALTGDLAGASSTAGALAGTLPALTGDLAGEVESASAIGVIAGALPALTGDLAGAGSSTAALAGALPQFTGDLAGQSSTSGTIAGTLPALAGDLAGAGSTAGAIAAILPFPTGDFNGVIPAVAVLTGALPALVGDLVGVADLPVSTPAGSVATVTARRTSTGMVTARRTSTATIAGG